MRAWNPKAFLEAHRPGRIHMRKPRQALQRRKVQRPTVFFGGAAGSEGQVPVGFRIEALRLIAGFRISEGGTKHGGR